ncbi:NUDIX hydrolase [Dysgonomonas termitidis]
MEYTDNNAVYKDVHIFLETASGTFLSEILINTVVFSFYNNNLKVLLLQTGEGCCYFLPEGYVFKDETIDDASLRILQQCFKLKDILYNEQFHISDETGQVNENIFSVMLRLSGIEIPEDSWVNTRKVSVCYYSLVDRFKVFPTAQDLFSSKLVWVDIRDISELACSHKDIISKAVLKLQEDMDRKPIAYNLLNKTFTLKELQGLHEAVFQKKIVSANFQRKMLCSNLLERLGKLYDGRSHRAPYLYKFKAKTKSKR